MYAIRSYYVLTKNNDEIIFAKKFQYPDKYHQSGGGGTQNAGWDVYNSPASYRGPSDSYNFV